MSRLLLTVLCTLAVTFFGLAADMKHNGEMKRQQLISMSKDDGLVHLDDSNYSHFVRSRPRPYSIVVFFTANDAKHGCSVCGEMYPEYKTLAESYWAQKNEGESASRQVTDIFFAVVDYRKSQETFNQLGLKTVPDMVHFPRSSKASGNDRMQLAEGEKMKMQNSLNADDMARWLRSRTGFQVNIRRSAGGSVVMGLATLVVLLLGARVALDHLPLLLQKIRNKNIWMYLSMCVYMTSISGVVFDIIRNPPPFNMNHQTGQIAFFNPQGNQQFVVEGLTIGLLNMALAGVSVALVVLLPNIRSKANRRNLTIAGVLVFAWVYSTIVSLYKFKNRWYRRM